MPVLSQLTDKYPSEVTQLLNVQVPADKGPEQTFCQILVDFSRRCSQIGATDAWQELVQQLRWAALLVRCVPLSSNSNVLFNKGLSDITGMLSAGVSDDELSGLAKKIVAALVLLSERTVSPLLTELGKHLREQNGTTRVAVLAYDRKLVPAILEALKSEAVPSHVSLMVADWATISREPVFDEICVFGSVRNLPEGIYKSGQGKAYTRFAYAWTRPDPVPKPWFEAFLGYEESIWDGCRFSLTTSGNDLGQDEFDLSPLDDHDTTDEEEQVNDTASGASLEDNASLGDDWLESFLAHFSEKVRARPIYLSGNRVLHVGPSLREDVFVLQPDSSDVQEIPVMDLRPGDCLIVPEAANRNYRRQLIDQKLGKKRIDCRKRQDEWKSGLAATIEQNGLPETIKNLQTLGCRRANAVNLYNWAYGSVVCPQRNADFAAIMSYLGFTQQYGAESHKLLRLILSASHQVSDIMLVEMRKAFARLDWRSMSQLDESPLTLSLGSGELRFRMIRVTGLGPVVEVERSAYETITNR